MIFMDGVQILKPTLETLNLYLSHYVEDIVVNGFKTLKLWNELDILNLFTFLVPRSPDSYQLWV